MPMRSATPVPTLLVSVVGVTEPSMRTLGARRHAERRIFAGVCWACAEACRRADCQFGTYSRQARWRRPGNGECHHDRRIDRVKAVAALTRLGRVCRSALAGGALVAWPRGSDFLPCGHTWGE